jgi:sporulation protein YlmC with PRC-barrel domain
MMGMSNLSGTPEGSIPMPEKDFKAKITDINSVDTSCSFVSINGKDFLKGKRGSASVTIPFEKIKTVEIKTTGDEKDVDAALKLTHGKFIKLKLTGNSDIYGKTDFGTIQIKIRDVSKIEFSMN